MGLVVAVVVVVAVVIPRVRASGPTHDHRDDPQRLSGWGYQPAGRAVAGSEGEDALAALGAATRELYRVVERTDFRVRSRLLAAEIAAVRPDLVGLQEVALWRYGPLDLERIGAPDAAEVDYDFLDLLLSELLAAGSATTSSRCRSEADVEAPAFAGPATGRPAAPAATSGSPCAT